MKTLDLRLPRSNSRFYLDQDGREFPRVTSVLGVLDKPALIHWAANLEREACIEAAWKTIAEASSKFGCIEDFRTGILRNLGPAKAHQKESSKAIEIGSQAHAWIEWHLRRETGETVGPEPALSEAAMRAAVAFFDWRDTVHFRPLYVEQRIFSERFRYAGTADVVANMTINGEFHTVVCDWKTSKGIYDEYILQNAAYSEALREMNFEPTPTAGLILRLPKSEADPSFEARFVSEQEIADGFVAFLSCLDIYRWTRAREAAKKEKR